MIRAFNQTEPFNNAKMAKYLQMYLNELGGVFTHASNYGTAGITIEEIKETPLSNLICSILEMTTRNGIVDTNGRSRLIEKLKLLYTLIDIKVSDSDINQLISTYESSKISRILDYISYRLKRLGILLSRNLDSTAIITTTATAAIIAISSFIVYKHGPQKTSVGYGAPTSDQKPFVEKFVVEGTPRQEKEYLMKEGDTLKSIAQDLEINVQTLRNYNPKVRDFNEDEPIKGPIDALQIPVN